MNAKNKKTKDYLGHEVVIVRDFTAPQELVFKAWTDPKHLAQWWGPRGFTNPVCQWPAKPGGEIYVVMRAPNGDDYPMGGTFREISPYERLVFTSGAMDDKKNLLFELLHTITFAEQKKGTTTVTVHSRVLTATADAGKYLGGYEAGMTQSLERLAQFLAQSGGPLVVERTFDAPVPRVWKAITNKEEMCKWSFGIKEFKPEVGFSFEFTAEDKGIKYIHLCTVTEAVPNRKLAYTWRYEGHEGESLVTIELFPEGNKTRLKLTHAGLETFPETPAFARKNFQMGWNSIIGSSLKAFVEGTGVNTKDREIISTRTFDAPRELIWEAWTHPEHLIHWWGPNGFTNTFHEFNPKPGGMWRYTMHGPNGQGYKNEVVFVEIAKPDRIILDHISAPHFRVTATFEAQGKKTKVTFHQVFETVEVYNAIKHIALPGNEQNFDRMAAHLLKMG